MNFNGTLNGSIADEDIVAKIALESLRENLRKNIRAEFEKVAQAVIDEAVDAACAAFETRLVAMKDLAMDRMAVKFSVERIKK